MNQYINLAGQTITDYLVDGRIFDAASAPESLKQKRAGCFVSIHRKDTQELRGCIGTILPTCKNLASEIVNNALSACRDPRFEPMTKEEINNLDISVDVLKEPEPINSAKALNPKKFGVIVKAKDGRTGLLLPDLEGVDKANDQIEIARQKAGILPDEPIYLYRFATERYESHPNKHKFNTNKSK